jgi:DNA polymerase-3 subunit gamma/tau
MLLSQQAQLVRLDANRAVVQVAGNWMGMVQSRASLLEQAVATALGGSRQLVLEASNNAMPPPMATPPLATAPITTSPITTPSITPPAAVEPPAPTPTPAPTSAPIAAPAAPPTPAPELPRTQAKPMDPKPAPAPPETSTQPNPPSGLDRQARNLADFFNGQVLDVDEIN